MNPNFLQGNKDHQMRLVRHFSSIHIPLAAHMTTLYSKNQPKYVKNGGRTHPKMPIKRELLVG